MYFPAPGSNVMMQTPALPNRWRGRTVRYEFKLLGSMLAVKLKDDEQESEMLKAKVLTKAWSLESGFTVVGLGVRQNSSDQTTDVL